MNHLRKFNEVTYFSWNNLSSEDIEYIDDILIDLELNDYDIRVSPIYQYGTKTKYSQIYIKRNNYEDYQFDDIRYEVLHVMNYLGDRFINCVVVDKNNNHTSINPNFPRQVGDWSQNRNMPERQFINKTIIVFAK